jgi:peptide/nickel transport system ATP-binding protein
VIVITHDISVLYQMADTMLVMYAGQLAEKAATDDHHARPRHPYTRLLISSLPEGGREVHREAPDRHPGQPAAAAQPAPGCRFRDRCPRAFAKCVEEPPFMEIEKGHHVACWAVFADEGLAAEPHNTEGALPVEIPLTVAAVPEEALRHA